VRHGWRVYGGCFAKKFGFWRPHIEKVIHRFLDCGALHNGFARVKCGDCGHEFLAALLNEGRITEELVEKLGNWQHSGFHVFCGEPIDPGNQTSMENLARYIIRASLSQERLGAPE
jgi:hypothetical protein